MAEPTLVIFDIDGTLAAHGNPSDPDFYDESRLAVMSPIPNMISMAKRYVGMSNVTLMFCSGRPKSVHRVTWDWLNRHLGLSASGKAVTLALRPESVPEDRIAPYKMSEIVQAVRRAGQKPEVVIFDDDITNLQMFEVVRPMVRRLRLYKVEDGIASQWGD